MPEKNPLEASRPPKLIHFASKFALESFMVALAWVALFYCNNLLFNSLSINPLVNWIFLPACIRMISVIIFEWAGVLGLIIGAVITSSPENNFNTNPWVLAIISGLGSYISVRFCQHALKLPASFDGLKPQHLFIFSAVGGVFNASLNHLYYQTVDAPFSFSHTFLPMIIGDFLGTLLLLYLIAITTKALKLRLE